MPGKQVFMSDVIICLFSSNGFDKSAQGLLGAGRRLATDCGGQLRAIVLGGGADALAGEVASVADFVIVADHADLTDYQPETCLNVLAQLCRELSPRAPTEA
jgi:electron transfer flavoprotein alpha subunit